jgi:hypothetical protein
MSFKKISYDGRPTKLEVFSKKDKLYKSLPIHKKGLELGLKLPKIYHVEQKGNRFYKYSEWVEGNTIQYEMDNNPSLIEPICTDLARYVNELYNANNISAVDSHFKNFVWNNNQVVYIDLKKLLYRSYEEHILQMAKICLKGCKGDTKKVFYFLNSYSKFRNVKPVIDECNNRNWQWKSMKGNVLKTEPIILNGDDQ